MGMPYIFVKFPLETLLLVNLRAHVQSGNLRVYTLYRVIYIYVL